VKLIGAIKQLRRQRTTRRCLSEMPIYVWKCEKCGTVVEELRKMDDHHPPVERKCDKRGVCELTKQVTAANFRIDPAAG